MPTSIAEPGAFWIGAAVTLLGLTMILGGLYQHLLNRPRTAVIFRGPQPSPDPYCEGDSQRDWIVIVGLELTRGKIHDAGGLREVCDIAIHCEDLAAGGMRTFTGWTPSRGDSISGVGVSIGVGGRGEIVVPMITMRPNGRVHVADGVTPGVYNEQAALDPSHNYAIKLLILPHLGDSALAERYYWTSHLDSYDGFSLSETR